MLAMTTSWTMAQTYVTANGLRFQIFNGTSYSYKYKNVTHNVDNSTACALLVKPASGKYSGNVAIPSEVTYNSKKYPVRAIATGAFQDNTSVTAITIPGSVQVIECDAFDDCDGCKTLTFEASDKELFCERTSYMTDWGAFTWMKELNTINLARTLTYPDANTSNGNNGYAPFYKCNESSKIQLTIKQGCKKIPAYTFYDTKVQTVDIEEGSDLISVDDCAFSQCTNLTSVKLENAAQLTYIGKEAFYRNSLTEVSIPAYVTTIGDNAFDVLSASNDIKSVSFYGADDSPNLINYDAANFKSAESVYLDRHFTTNGVTDKASFPQCTSVLLGTHVKEVTPYLFYDTKVTSAFVPANVTKVGAYAFHCKDLATLTLADGENTLQVDEKAFYTPSVSDFYLGRNVTYSGTLGMCYGMTIGKAGNEASIMTIGGYVTAFNPNMLTSSTDSSVGFCNVFCNARNIVIKTNAFKNILIENLVFQGNAKIEPNAFSSTSPLKTLTFYTEPELKERALFGCFAIKNVTVKIDAPKTMERYTNVFENAVYADAMLTNISNASNAEALIEELKPWCMFLNRKVGVDGARIINEAHPITKDEKSNSVMLSSSIQQGKFAFMHYPFKISTYYFGSDARVFTTSSSDFEAENHRMKFRSLNLETSYTMPSTPLLIYSQNECDNIQGTIDLFKEKEISISNPTAATQLGTVANGMLMYADAAGHEVNPSSEICYVVRDNCLKRVNKSGFKTTPYEVYLISTKPDAEIALLDIAGNTLTDLAIPSTHTITPHARLEGYVTFYSNESDFELATEQYSEGHAPKVYVLAGASDGVATLLPIEDGIINKGQAVIIKTDKTDAGKKLCLRMVTHGTTDAAYESNLLKGVDKDTPVSDLNSTHVLVLSCDNNYENVGFYKYSSSKTLGAFKAYLLPQDIPAAVKALTLPTNDEETAIEAVSSEGNALQSIYDVNGRTLNAPAKKHINIINHKKVLVK